MTAFGQDLKTQRERCGVSLDALAAETKVAPRYLQALEAGEFAQLPGGIFRRGIVRAYLHAIQLEEEPWMLRFQDVLRREAELRGEPAEPEEAAWATFAENVKRNRTREKTGSGIRWLGVLLLLIMVAAAALATWRFVLHRRLFGLPSTSSQVTAQPQEGKSLLP